MPFCIIKIFVSLSSKRANQWHYYATSESVTIVENNSFIPEPEVDSEVIKLKIRKEYPVKLLDEQHFFKVIKASFTQRRKTLINALVNTGILKNKIRPKSYLTI